MSEQTPSLETQIENTQNEVETPQEAGVESSNEAEQLQELENKDTSDMSKAEKKVHEKKLEKFKFKVYGKEFEEEIDLSDKEGLTKRLQKAHAADKTMSEGAELRKSAEQFIELLKTNPRKVLTDPNINVDLKKFVQEYLDEQIENAAKSPEQLKLEEAERKLAEIEEKYKKDEEARKKDQMERLQAEHEQKVQDDISSALESSSLPKTPYTVRKMAEKMIQALENDIEISPKDLVPLIRKEMEADIKELFSASSDDILEELLGKDNITRIRKRSIAKVKQNQVAQTANSVKPTGNKEEAPKKEDNKQTIRDFFKL